MEDRIEKNEKERQRNTKSFEKRRRKKSSKNQENMKKDCRRV